MARSISSHCRSSSVALLCLAGLAGCGGTQDPADPNPVSATYWADSASGLSWEQPTKAEGVTYPDAEAHCDALVVQGLSDWRLPKVTELRTLLRGCPGTVSSGSCEVHDSCAAHSCRGDSCSACVSGEGPSEGCYRPAEAVGTCGRTWSSSPVEGYADLRWHVGFNEGSVSYSNTNSSVLNLVRCVRKGQ